MTQFTVRLLGSVEIRDAAGRESETLPRQPKRLGLLAYLAFARPRGFHRRDKLVALFWPEDTQEQARHSLTQALHVLRTELGDTAIKGRGQSDVAIDEALISCDVVEFESAVEDGEYEKALELYRGDLLQGLFVREALEFERWLEDERTRLREKAAGAAWALAHEHIRADCLVDAERTAQRALLLVLTDEGEVRRFIQALADAGDRAAAVRFYEKFAQRLRSEYEIEPDPATVAVVQALASAQADHHGTSLASGNAVAAAPASRVTSSVGMTPIEARTTKTPFTQNKRFRIVVAAAAFVVALIAAAILLPRWSGRALDPNRVLVVALADESGREEITTLGRMAQDYIIQVLTDGRFAKVVDPLTALAVSQNVAAAAVESEPDDVLALADEGQAGTVVSGSYYTEGDSVFIQIRITDANDGSVMQSIGPVVGSLAAPSELVGRLGKAVGAALAPLLNRDLTSWGPAVQPRSIKAYQAYTEGLEAYLETKHAEAARLFERAAAADSTFTRAVLWAVNNYKWAGQTSAERSYYAKADSLLAPLVESRERLTPYERCRLDFAMALGPPPDFAALYEATRCTAEQAPGSDIAKRELSLLAYQMNRPREAIERLGELDPDRGLMKHCRCYWPAVAKAYHMLGNYEAELEAARQARNRFPENVLWLAEEARILAALGRLDEVAANLDAIRSLTSGERVSRYLYYVAIALRAHGHRDAALGLFNEAIVRMQSRPHDSEDARGALAWFLYNAERWDDALRLYEELADEYPENTVYVAVLGQLAARRGDRAEAMKFSEKLGSLEDPVLQPRHTLWRAKIAALLGDREEAMNLLQRALDQGVNFGYGTWLYDDIDLQALRDYPPFQEFMRPKG
jgi:DNA-binding SARP family transcriptional activator/TolB-like protein